jgi:hypothetical protein
VLAAPALYEEPHLRADRLERLDQLDRRLVLAQAEELDYAERVIVAHDRNHDRGLQVQLFDHGAALPARILFEACDPLGLAAQPDVAQKAGAPLKDEVSVQLLEAVRKRG